MHVNPKPVQQPHPPIWIGGFSDAALHRAARFAALWQPTPLPVAELVERQTALHQKFCVYLRWDGSPDAPIPEYVSFPHHHIFNGADEDCYREPAPRSQ